MLTIILSEKQCITSLLQEIATGANTIITPDLEILSAFENEANERRYSEIEGFARVPCGGTHVKRTGEIGPLRLNETISGAGKDGLKYF